MALDNYRDLSISGSDVSSGFQFEFYCSSCNSKWKSPFKPYRMGQITGLLRRFAFLFSGGADAGRVSVNFSDMGSRGAYDSAFREALERAQSMYVECSQCHKGVCHDCFDTRKSLCLKCIREQEGENEQKRAQAEHISPSSECPNCRQPHSGGRFCAECGFDMASTHKSCPGCGALALRSARFCTDCGHSY